MDEILFFKTIAELREYADVPVESLTLDRLAPTMRQVQERYILDILGTDEYENLQTEYEADTLDAVEEALLDRVRMALAPLTLLYFASQNDVGFSNMGFTVKSTDNTAPASQWRVENYKSEMARNGYNHLQDLLTFLWANTGDYPDWAGSTNYTKWRNCLINTASDFDEHYAIGGYFQLFLQLKPTIRNVQRLYIKPLLGDLYDEIQDEVTTDTLTAENQALLDEYIRPAVALLTIYEGHPTLAIDITSAGTTNRSRGDTKNMAVIQPAAMERLNMNMMQAKDLGKTYLNRLRNELNSNASESKYATYFDSDTYVAPSTEDPPEYDGETSAAVKW